MPDHCFLIGKAPGWEKAPQEGETWGVNDLLFNRDLKLTFEMHDLEKHRKWDFFQKEIEELNKRKIPVVTQKKYDFLPYSIPFPFDEMPFQYFTSSIAYMVAYAVHKEVKKIDVYGISMATRDEYIRQRACVEFWIGYAIAKGIEVNINRPSQLLEINIKGNQMTAEKGMYGIHWDNIGRREPMLDKVILKLAQ